MTHRVFFRVDSEKTIGSGHAMRSLALASQIKADGAEVIIVGSGLKEIQNLAASFSGLDVSERTFESLEDEIEAIGNWNADLIIFDGYHFSAELFLAVKNLGVLVGVIDDNGETRASEPTFVVNQNPTADRCLYPETWEKTRFFLGWDYLILRDEFLNLSLPSDEIDREGILVAIGGTDALGIVPDLIDFLSDIETGFQTPRTQFGERHMKNSELAHSRLNLFGPEDYPTFVRSAAVAVLGGGTGLYEALHSRTPTIAAVVADNQVRMAQSLFESGYILGVVDFQGGFSREAATQVLEIIRRTGLRTKAPSSSNVPSGFGQGKKILSEEIRKLLANL